MNRTSSQVSSERRRRWVWEEAVFAAVESEKKKYNASFFVLFSFHDHYQGGFIPRTIIIIVVGSMVLSN